MGPWNMAACGGTVGTRLASGWGRRVTDVSSPRRRIRVGVKVVGEFTECGTGVGPLNGAPQVFDQGSRDVDKGREALGSVSVGKDEGWVLRGTTTSVVSTGK